LIEASQCAHIEILSFFLSFFFFFFFFFFPFLVSWVAFAFLALPHALSCLLFFFSFPFPSSLSLPPSPPPPIHLRSINPQASLTADPQVFKRVIAVLKSVCIEFARLQTIQTISFVTFSPRCQLAWLSWQQQSFYPLPYRHIVIISSSEEISPSIKAKKREKKKEKLPTTALCKPPPPSSYRSSHTHKRLALKVISRIK